MGNEWILFLAVVALAVVFVLMAQRLKSAHPTEWNAMGGPVAQTWRGNYKGRWGLLKFLFSEEHAKLNDSNLTTLVWAMRALLVAVVVLLAMQLWGGQHGTL